MAPVMPDTAWVLASDPEAWETHARACFAASVDGECPLDVTKKNILNYSQGSFSLIEADLRATLPADLAAAVTDALVREGLTEAFDLRRNLVSLKKVLLHCWHAADPLEHELRRMATFWRDDMNFENGFVLVERYREVCVAHMRCKGASHAAYDGRVITKQICCVPRHPDAPRPARLVQMPTSLTTRSWLKQARDALRATDGGDGGGDGVPRDAVVPGDVGGGDGVPEDVGVFGLSGNDGVEEGHKTPAREALDTFLARVARRLTRERDVFLPEHVATHLERVLIARGGAKALAIHRETESYAALLDETAGSFEGVCALLEARTRSVETVLREDVGASLGGEEVSSVVFESERKEGTSPPKSQSQSRRFRKRGVDYDETAVSNLRVANAHDRLRGLLHGCAPATRDLARAVADIVKRPSRRLFAAGDHGGADFFPAEFRLGTRIARHRATVAKWRPVMFAELDAMVPGASAGVLSGSGDDEAVPGADGSEPASTNEISTDGDENATWPPDAARAPALAYLRGKQKCGACGGAFGGLWVQRGTCFRCDAIARRAGVCPKSRDGKNKKKPCPPSAWCPHRRRCLACEALSFSGCAACGVTRGDGEDVALMAESVPDLLCVFLDFDRTLCATKQGASPRLGARATDSVRDDDDSAKPEDSARAGGSKGSKKTGGKDASDTTCFAEFDRALMSVATSHRETHVVTRNAHVDDIAAFLARRGVRDAERKVHRAARGESKATAIRAVLRAAAARRPELAEPPRRAVSIFVDDSIAELMDEEVAAIPGLSRVLFSRVVA